MSNHKGPPIASVSPTIEKGEHCHGILKFNYDSSAISTTTTNIQDTSIILCTYAIPFHLSIPEFLEFIAPVDPFVSHYRIVRDVNPDLYMVLMKFRDPYSANNYYKQYNNRLFSSMEPEKCKVIYIEAIEINSVTIPPYTFPFIQQMPTKEEEEESLPICPVCLEPMNENTTGLLTIFCQHTFHCHCLSKWGDGSCPVCRYSQKSKKLLLPSEVDTSSSSISIQNNSTERMIGDQDEDNECALCHSKESLWICLICGNIGCGRYMNAHAYEHYRQTNHLYALEIDTQRVWDYAGDNYVQRLIQNAVDGKLVELPSAADYDSNENVAIQEKLEAISIEYNYLLSSQLDSQRIYYENQIDEVSSQLSVLASQSKALLEKFDKIQNENKSLEISIEQKDKLFRDLIRTKLDSDSDLHIWKERFENAKDVWSEEKELTNSLSEINSLLLKSIEDREKAIDELSDQIRDLNFFLEAREKVQGHPELEGGSVETHTRQVKPSRRRGKRL
ncbi:uncharacterized protein BX663DRAFT_515494 [Cokeromyces recurvatus]|uniref:uncharacterized protein n=1 Tax=Cokeromyces recurvatus TaxID=90255 RepID=UPI00221F1B93|nr:uncharacterized protein BX663DRAFT_515494 [Cokeromyces recurvatus]KAI7901280.1 hypothetical protein BX663DRAFT_515494 [Cokeromyces recurvatus]